MDGEKTMRYGIIPILYIILASKGKTILVTYITIL